MTTKRIPVVCPECGASGQTLGMVGQPVNCPDCGREFRAVRPGFWERQKMNSPVMQYWWLGPLLLSCVLWYLGLVNTLGLFALVIIALLVRIVTLLSRGHGRARPNGRV